MQKPISDELIQQFLQEAPLYSWREFSLDGFKRTDILIHGIDDHCEICNKTRPFHDMRSRGSGANLPGMTVRKLESGTTYYTFTCVTCNTAKREFLVERDISDNIIRIQKFGELPQRRLKRNKVVEKFLKSDQKDYEKAVVCLAHGYGIASFAYLRRIIERNIIKILDSIQEDATETGQPSTLVEQINALRKESHMSEKISIANQALPGHLVPNGFNPLGAIYQALSEGVHSLPDDECLSRSESIHTCLCFLVSELASRKETRNNFKASLAKLKA